MNEEERVHGYFWHVDCVYRSEAGGRRRDDGGDIVKGSFVKRAITVDEARHVDRDDGDPTCHWCIRHDRDGKEGDSDDYIVVSYELGGALCDCGDVGMGPDRGTHDRNGEVAERIWMGKREKGEQMTAGKYICAECWYKDNDLPPEREDRPDGANCQACDDYVTEVVYIPGTDERDATNVVDDDDDDDEDMEVLVEWSRLVTYTEYFTHTITDLDAQEREMFNDGDTEGIVEWLHDVAHDESEDHNRVDQDWFGFGDDCPVDIDWEVN